MEAIKAINAAHEIIDDVRTDLGEYSENDQILKDELSKALILLDVAKLSAQRAKSVLRKLVDSFPEMLTDEPINGSDAVDVLSGMWGEIKEALK